MKVQPASGGTIHIDKIASKGFVAAAAACPVIAGVFPALYLVAVVLAAAAVCVVAVVLAAAAVCVVAVVLAAAAVCVVAVVLAAPAVCVIAVILAVAVAVCMVAVVLAAVAAACVVGCRSRYCKPILMLLTTLVVHTVHSLPDLVHVHLVSHSHLDPGWRRTLEDVRVKPHDKIISHLLFFCHLVLLGPQHPKGGEIAIINTAPCDSYYVVCM